MVFGVLQAFIVQQDALRFMHKLLVDPETPKKFKPKGTAWMQLRDLRDSVAGHPASLLNHTGIVGLGKEDCGVQTFSRRENLYTKIRPHILSLLPKYEVEVLETLDVIDAGIEVWMDRQAENHAWLKNHLAEKRANR